MELLALFPVQPQRSRVKHLLFFRRLNLALYVPLLIVNSDRRVAQTPALLRVVNRLRFLEVKRFNAVAFEDLPETATHALPLGQRATAWHFIVGHHI